MWQSTVSTAIADTARIGRDAKRVAHTGGMTRPEVLAGHRRDREPERHDRHEAGLDDPQPDAEAGLRGRSERPDDGVDDEEIDRHQRELGAGREPDGEQPAPLRQVRSPIRRHEGQERSGGQEVHRHPYRADHERRRATRSPRRRRRAPLLCPSRRSETGPAPCSGSRSTSGRPCRVLKLPVPRRAALIGAITNCSAIAGTNHRR